MDVRQWLALTFWFSQHLFPCELRNEMVVSLSLAGSRPMWKPPFVDGNKHSPLKDPACEEPFFWKGWPSALEPLSNRIFSPEGTPCSQSWDVWRNARQSFYKNREFIYNYWNVSTKFSNQKMREVKVNFHSHNLFSGHKSCICFRRKWKKKLLLENIAQINLKLNSENCQWQWKIVKFFEGFFI